MIGQISSIIDIITIYHTAMTFTAPLNNHLTPNAAIHNLATLKVTGIDAASFLQSQFTQDLLNWQPNEIKRAAWCNAKGRMLVSFYIWQTNNTFYLLLAKDLVKYILPKLRMFILRAKVLISDPLPIDWFIVNKDFIDLNDDWAVHNHLTHNIHSLNGCISDISTLSSPIILNLLPKTIYNPCGLILSNRLNINNDLSFNRYAFDWHVAHIQSGVAWIDAKNTEKFVPQTVNFELVNGVNFRKGCYPGQEIIARSQYLGKLKQRAVIATIDNINHTLIPESLPFGTYLYNKILQSIDYDQITIVHAKDGDQSVGKVICIANTTTTLWVLLTIPYNILNLDKDSSIPCHSLSNSPMTAFTTKFNSDIAQDQYHKELYMVVDLKDINVPELNNNEDTAISNTFNMFNQFIPNPINHTIKPEKMYLKLHLHPLPYSIIDITK